MITTNSTTVLSSMKSNRAVSRKRKERTTRENAADDGKKFDKRRKFDPSVASDCLAILKTLITNRNGWAFNQAVEPMGLKSSDYFKIISNPMDLGRIKSKMEKNMYFDKEEFAADIRLTFSNAMLYNTNDTPVHKMATQLSNIFEQRWKALEKWNGHESSKNEQAAGQLSSGRVKELTRVTRKCTQKALPLRPSLSPKIRSILSTEKVKRSSEEINVQPAWKAKKCRERSSREDFHRGTDSRNVTCGPVNAKPPMCSSFRKCLNDSSSKRPFVTDHLGSTVDTSRQDCRAKQVSESQLNTRDQDSEGARRALDFGEHARLSSQPSTLCTDATSTQELVDLQLSPKRALRVAMLRSRFADTIIKAKVRTMTHSSDAGNKADPASTMQQEKERFERKNREEMAKIEAQINKERQREREAARAVLQKMKKTVDFGDSLWVQKEFDMLVGVS